MNRGIRVLQTRALPLEPHAPRFTVRAQACGESAEGEGGSLRAAQQAAAKELLFRLEERTGG